MPAPGACQVCRHPEVAEIDRLLLTGDEGGTRPLAERYGVSRASLVRHRKHHMARALAAASGAVVTRVDPDPTTLVHQVADLERRARNLMDRADVAGDLKTALKGVAELRAVLELLAKLAGELSGTGLSRAEVKRIAREMAAVVEAVVRDPEQLERIRDGWRRVRF
jgi:hypothetical protein